MVDALEGDSFTGDDAAMERAKLLTSKRSRLAEVFSSQVRAEVLTWMFARKDAAHSLTELARSLGLAVSSVQHEVYKLERIGILVGRRDGVSRRYRLTVDDPLTQALELLVRTEVGIEATLQIALAETPGLVWSTVAANPGDVVSGVELVLVGEIDLGGLAAIQERIASVLGVQPREVETSFYTPAVWQQHQLDGHALVEQLKSMNTLAVYGETA